MTNKMIDEEKLKEEMVIMKKSMAKLFREKDRKYIGTLRNYNEGIILAVANFKCQNPNCLSEKDLQIHHLIMRTASRYMDFWRYASARYYWSNQILLCDKCHKQYHKDMGRDIGEKKLVLSEDKINKWKKEFEKKEEGEEQ